ncbi:hypothetical protein EZJ58_4069 [Sodalis ligni]|uniref:Uncharacterized protein n=2 Tax=Sodalis ligni TaxID=2697027 RepID=A0A4R1NFT8_9GAMM|nr:hypothetical protein EZJ58_4069 [Sodalis ligni]
MALEPPILPQAINGQISMAIIQSDGGVVYRIPQYQNSKMYDLVQVFWNGILVGTHTIGNPITDFPITGLVAVQLVRAGVNSINYIVSDSFGNVGYSFPTDVNIAISSLSMIISTGAANLDFDAIRVNPFNRGVVYGNPGARIRLDIAGLAYFYETDERFYELIIDGSGQGFFRLWSYEQGGNFVIARDQVTGETISQPTVFDPFRAGEDKILYVNYTTGAPANNRTYNSIYVKTDTVSNRGTPITQILAQIQNSSTASIIGGTNIGGPSYSLISLNSDQSATIDIIDSVAEPVTVILSLPQASGSSLFIDTAFASRPVGFLTIQPESAGDCCAAINSYDDGSHY